MRNYISKELIPTRLLSACRQLFSLLHGALLFFSPLLHVLFLTLSNGRREFSIVRDFFLSTFLNRRVFWRGSLTPSDERIHEPFLDWRRDIFFVAQEYARGVLRNILCRASEPIAELFRVFALDVSVGSAENIHASSRDSFSPKRAILQCAYALRERFARASLLDSFDKGHELAQVVYRDFSAHSADLLNASARGSLSPTAGFVPDGGLSFSRLVPVGTFAAWANNHFGFSWCPLVITPLALQGDDFNVHVYDHSL